MTYTSFINHPYKKYHSAFLNDYLESIKHLDLSQEFNSLNLSQVSFHILYNCEFSSWSEKLREEVQKVKQIYMVNSIFAQILHPVERRYVDRDKYHFERHFENDEFVEDFEESEDSLLFEEDKIYQILPKKFTRVYNNVYYDNHTNEEDYYEDKEDSDLGSDSEEPLSYVPFKGLNEFSTISLTSKEVSKIVEDIKLEINNYRFKLFTVNLTEEDIRPFYHFVDLNDEKLYEEVNDEKVSIYVNKDHPDPIRRKKVRDFANLYFAYDLYKFHYENMSKNSKIIDGINWCYADGRYYDGIYVKYGNMSLSFLNYSITNDHHVKKIFKNNTIPNSSLSHNFNENNIFSKMNKPPQITLKVKYNKLSQEELTLLDKYPMQAAFIYKNYHYLNDTSNILQKNYDPFFNMLRILEKTNCKLNIEEI